MKLNPQGYWEPETFEEFMQADVDWLQPAEFDAEFEKLVAEMAEVVKVPPPQSEA